MRRALVQGTQDGRLFLHAAAILRAAGRHDESARWLSKSHRLRATLLPSERDELASLQKTIAPKQES
jgi:hypothetical protein